MSGFVVFLAIVGGVTCAGVGAVVVTLLVVWLIDRRGGASR